MGVQVFKAEDEDMPRLFEIASLAFQRNEPFWDAIWPKHWTEEGRIQGGERFKATKNKNPHVNYLKAVDDTGRIVGFGKWDIYINRIQEDNKDDNDYWNDPEEKVYVGELVECFLKERKGAIVRTNGNLASLDVLAVDPSSQRQGAGSALVEWGLKKADELGIDSVVESSVFGKTLYEKYGFVFQRDVKVGPSSKKFAGRDAGDFAWYERPARTKQ